MNLWFNAVSVDHTAEVTEVIGYRLAFDDAVSPRYPAVLTDEQYISHPDYIPPDDGYCMLDHLYEPDTVSIDPNTGKRDWAAEGLPFTRIPSLGSNDGGDVHGPFTAIEVKNYRNPPVSSLLSNAEWKADNAGKPYWFLCYKADGMGDQNVGKWHTLTTVQHLITGYGLDFKIDEVGGLCYRNEVMRLEVTNLAPSAKRPPLPWSVDLVFTARMTGLERIRNEIWNERYSFEDRVIPIVVSPRRSTTENYSIERWYAYTKLSGSCRILETLGVLPQDATEYPTA